MSGAGVHVCDGGGEAGSRGGWGNACRSGRRGGEERQAGASKGWEAPPEGDEGLLGADMGTRRVPASPTETRGNGGESGLLGGFSFLVLLLS